MTKILCTLPNASTNINNVDFVKIDEGMLAEDVSEDAAEQFLKVPGFSVFEPAVAVAFDYAKESVGHIKEILEEYPESHERVWADELAGREMPRDGVVKAVEVAKQKLGEQDGD